MDSVTEYDPNLKRMYSRETTTGGQVSSDLAAAAAGTTAGKNLAAHARSARKPMPKQSDFPGDTAGWQKALREWRTEADSDPANEAQKKALRSMSTGG